LLNDSPAKTEAKTAPAPAPTSKSAAAPVPKFAATTSKPAAPKQPLEASKPSADTTAKFPPTTGKSDAEAALALEIEKRKRRAERFGIPLADSAKAIERAKRFGDTTPGTEQAKKEARGKKVGNQVWTKIGKKSTADTAVKKILDDPEEAEKAKKRAERFGGGNEAKKVKT